jgi:RNA polymerase sigma factor (sigma-70 family)
MPSRSIRILQQLKRTKTMNRHTSPSTEQHQQILLLLPWFLNQSLEHNERQLVESHLCSCDLCSGLLMAWKKPEYFDFPSKLSTWIFNSDYPAQRLESKDWLSCAFATLQPDQRAVIELTFCHGLHYQDIARILNCPENTIKTRMFHARKKLQVFAATQEIITETQED